MTAPQTEKICPSCGSKNRPDCRFCTGCGREFPEERTCPRCSATVSASQRFCNACGAPVDAAPEAPAGGKMTFCHQCRALIDREAKFCNQCGAVIADMPLCPQCGDPIGPEEKFCGVCGLPFTSAAPAQQSPARPVVPPTVPPYSQPVIQSVPVKSGGISVGKILVGIVLVLVVLVGIIMILPDSPPPPPPAGGGTVTAEIFVPTGEDPAATQAAIDASNAIVKGATDALANGDSAGFTSYLVAEDRGVLEGASFDPSRAASIAGAFRDAKVTAASPTIVHYEMTTGTTTYTFYTFQEEGSWKIAGL